LKTHIGLLLKNNWYGAPKKIGLVLQKKGGSVGKKFGAVWEMVIAPEPLPRLI
jgi:hypothetical protein